MNMTYVKYAWFFLILLGITSVFAYSGYKEFSQYLIQVCYSFSLSVLAHYLVFQLCQFLIKNRTLFNIILLIVSLLILALNIGFYVGVRNWGSPINIDLVKAGLSDFKGVVAMALQKKEILIALILGIAVIYFFYNRSSKSLFPLQNKSQNFGKNVIFLSTNILAIVGLIFIYPIIAKDKKGNLKEEVYFSFFEKSSKLLRIEKLKLGVENVAKTYPKIEDFDKKNVIFFSVDCLRADHLSFNGYSRETSPYLDSLYEAGRLKKYKLSTSTCSTSFCGILSMLNSKNLQGLSYLKYGIQDYLKRQGYKTNFILSGVHEGWYNIKKHYGTNIDYFVEGKDKPEFNSHDDALIVDEIKQMPEYSGDPNFFFFHFMGPHSLGYKDSSFEKFQPIIEKSLVRKIRLGGYNDENLRRLYTNNYDNGVYQSDQYIKEILSILRKKGYLENAVVAIAGDHGESLGENSSYLGHGDALTDEYINIPILFIEDDISSYKEDLYASQIDIAPTIISRLGLPAPDVWQGTDLNMKQKNRVTLHEQTPYGREKSHIGVITAGNNLIRKYIIDQNSGDELILQTDYNTNSRDTLFLTNSIKDYFRNEVLKYKGDNYVEFKNIQDVLLTKRAAVGEINEVINEKALEFSKLCEPYTKELFSEIFVSEKELLLTISATPRKKSCTSHFFWNSPMGVTNKAYLTTSINAKLKRKVNLLIRKENFIRLKGKRFSNICFNKELRTIVWTSGDSQFHELHLEEGGDVSFDSVLAFVRKHFNKEKHDNI